MFIRTVTCNTADIMKILMRKRLYGECITLFLKQKRRLSVSIRTEGKQSCLLTMDMGDGFIDVEAYQDGWLYYTTFDRSDDIVCRLCAVSLEGEKREIIAFTSYVNQQHYYSYTESILQLKVDGDRVFFIFGGYDGTAHVFQGGTLISIKLDGTDYKAVETEWDDFYLSHAGGKTLIYYPRYYYPFHIDPDIEYDMYVWDIDANKCYLTDFPRKILDGYRRLRTEVYRLKIGESAAQMLYSY